VDSLVNEVISFASDEIGKYPGFKGAKSTIAVATITGNIPMGADVGATPDGRHAGEPISEGGISPHQGRNISGVTATMASVAHLNFLKFRHGSVLNLRIDPEAVACARRNAATAGVDGLIDFQVCDFRETRFSGENACIVLNPPYGERLGEVRELEPLYKAIGDWLKQKCQGATGHVFTGNRELGKKIGLKPDRRFEFFNAKIECRLFRYGIY